MVGRKSESEVDFGGENVEAAIISVRSSCQTPGVQPQGLRGELSRFHVRLRERFAARAEESKRDVAAGAVECSSKRFGVRSNSRDKTRLWRQCPGMRGIA